MHTNNTNKEHGKIIYPELSYAITGICFKVHNECGRFSREKQYGDLLEKKLKEAKIPFERELNVGSTGNVVDFIIENKIILELKAKDSIVRDDYYQIQRYLQSFDTKLGLLINFRNKHLKPIRIVKIDTRNKNRFLN